MMKITSYDAEQASVLQIANMMGASEQKLLQKVLGVRQSYL